MHRWTCVLVLIVLVAGGCERRRPFWSVERPVENAQGEPVFEEPWADYRPDAPDPGRLPRAAEQRLAENGFVMLADCPVFDITNYYFDASPQFITSDVVLYVFATLFRGGLIEHERDTLKPMLEDLVAIGIEAARAHLDVREGGPLAEPARSNLLLFGVAATLLGDEPPEEVADAAREIAAKIEAAEATEYYPGEDWTIYTLRGHYAENEDLAGYFRATKWLSRYIMPLVPGKEQIVDPAEGDARLRQAVLLGRLIREDEAVGEAWRAYMDELSFFIGSPDSIEPVSVADAADRVLPSGYADGPAPELATDGALATLRAEFALARYRPSAIMSVPQARPGDLPEKYCQLIGERYIVDSEIMQRTVFPYVGDRLLPSGLDIGATVMGFERAKAHLEPEFEEYGGLEPQIETLAQEFGGLSAQTDSQVAPIYDQWLGALAELSRNAPEAAPAFMRTDAWRDKQLNCALASWTMLRHDYLLYGKQPMTPGCAGDWALIEPVPELYRRIGHMASALAERDFRGMDGVAELCRNLREALAVQLGERPREEVEIDEGYWLYLGMFGHWLTDHFTPHISVHDPTCVVDVSSTLQPVAGPDQAGVLQVATGPLYPIIARADLPNAMGGDRYVGLVMSYYEWQVWTDENAERMTDGQWREVIRRKRQHERRPAWTDSFMVR